jgi:hypothetical protein
MLVFYVVVTISCAVKVNGTNTVFGDDVCISAGDMRPERSDYF